MRHEKHPLTAIISGWCPVATQDRTLTELRALLGSESTVDDEAGSSHERAVRRCQKDDCVGDLLWFRHPTKRMKIRNLLSGPSRV
jgi:hypothetical protein